MINPFNTFLVDVLPVDVTFTPLVKSIFAAPFPATPPPLSVNELVVIVIFPIPFQGTNKP